MLEVSHNRKFGSDGSLPWYAVRVRSNFEVRTQIALRSEGFETFLPTFETRRQWSDRMKTVSVPIFPGYVFCSFDLTHRLVINQTAGVAGIVGTKNGALPIDPSEMKHLQTVVWSKVPLSPHPLLRVGQWVVVERGPLTGVEGIVKELKVGCRIVVSISLLQRAVAAQIEADWVRPSAPSGKPYREFENRRTNISSFC